MPKETWIIASVLTVLLLLGLLGLTSWEKKNEVEKVRAELVEAQAAAAKAEADGADLRGKLADWNLPKRPVPPKLLGRPRRRKPSRPRKQVPPTSWK